MTFEERKQIAMDKVVEFLGDFTAPRGMEDTVLARRITSIADAFARKMPIGQEYESKIDAALTKLRDSHMSNTWPPQAAFVEVMPKGEIRKGAPATYKPEAQNWLSKRMSAGDPVPESQIWRSVDVDREILERYRFAAVSRWRGIYGPDAEQMMAEKYGPSVRRYFLEPIDG